MRRPRGGFVPLQQPAGPYNPHPMSGHLAIYTGSFDPITYGHLDVLQRARSLFDEIVVAIGRNPEKVALFSIEERLSMAESLVGELVADDEGGASI